MTRELTEGQRQGYLDAALRAADWFVAGQLCQYRPMAAQGDSRQWRDNDVLPGGGDASVPWTEGKGRMWDANRGRFPYYYFMPDGRHVPGLSWTQGRGIFVLADAYKITGDSRYLETAEFAADYIASLQFVDPHFPQVRGAIREHTPTGAWAGSLDAAQAASALILLTKVGGDKRWLARGREFCDYILRHSDASVLLMFYTRCMSGTIYVAPIWNADRSTLERLQRHIAAVYGTSTALYDPGLDLQAMFDPSRGQYNSSKILLALLQSLPRKDAKFIGIVDVDLFIPVLTFVFGEAQLDGNVALASTYRLHNELYGLSEDYELMVQRLEKEVVHELGHTFNLIHCRDHACVMHSSTFVEDIDLKSNDLCTSCKNCLNGC